MRPSWALLTYRAISENRVPLKPRPITEQKLLKFSTEKDTDGCISEMTLLLSCLKEDASGRHCTKEMDNLQACYSNYQKKEKRQKEERKRQIPAVNAKVLTQEQKIYMLKKYPLV